MIDAIKLADSLPMLGQNLPPPGGVRFCICNPHKILVCGPHTWRAGCQPHAQTSTLRAQTALQPDCGRTAKIWWLALALLEHYAALLGCDKGSLHSASDALILQLNPQGGMGSAEQVLLTVCCVAVEAVSNGGRCGGSQIFLKARDSGYVSFLMSIAATSIAF